MPVAEYGCAPLLVFLYFSAILCWSTRSSFFLFPYAGFKVFFGAVLNVMLLFETNDFACDFLLVAGSWRLCDGNFLSDFSNLCLGLTCIPPLSLFCFFTILCGGCEETGCDDCGGCDG